MYTADMSFSCPECESELQSMKMALGEGRCLVIAGDCPQCKERVVSAFTMGFFNSLLDKFDATPIPDKAKEQKLLNASKELTGDDLAWLHEMGAA